MKIGQTLKTVLYELGLKSWKKTFIWGGMRFALSTTVSPKNNQARAIEILLQAGLMRIHHAYVNSHDEDDEYDEAVYHVVRENKIFIHFVSDEKKENIPYDVFTTLEHTIDEMLGLFSTNWQQIDLGNSGLSRFAHQFEPDCPDLKVLLRVLANIFSADLAIPLDIDSESPGDRITIEGNADDIRRFITSIKTDLSPTHYEPAIPVQIFPSLQQRCAKEIAKSFPKPNFFSTLNALPLHLQHRVQEATWKHLQFTREVEPYAGKIVLFQADYDKSIGYLIYPDQPDIKVGLIHDFRDSNLPDVGLGYRTATFLKPDEVRLDPTLATPTMKYENLKVRLPTVDELSKIEKAFVMQEGNFGASLWTNPLDLIQQQRIEQIMLESNNIEEHHSQQQDSAYI